MTIESEFETQVSSKKLTNEQVIALVRTYRKKIEESGLAQNTRFTKMSRINAIVKRLYGEHLYTEVLKFNIPDRQEKKSAIQARNEFNIKRLENRQEFSFNEIMTDINTLKESQNYYELVVCILLSSGRRANEVIARGNFEKSKIPHHCLFSGQLKSKGEERDAYDIPVLGMSPDVLIGLVEKIREKKDFSDKSNEFIASRTNAYVNKAIVDVLDTKDRHVTSESLRCVYAFIAYRLYGNPRISEAVYGSKILGHIGIPHTFVDNYNRVFVSGIKGEETTIEDLRREIAEKDTEIASLKKQIAALKNQIRKQL